MQQWFRIVLGIGLLLLIGPGGIMTAQTGYTPAFEWDTCPFDVAGGEVDGETVECGWLTVPESRADPGGQTIELAVAVIYSTSAAPAADPVIYLEGGPGGSALAGIDLWYESALREARDIILIDQRGTGYSEPALNCDEDDAADAAASALACRTVLEAEGVNLAAYNSYENAQDVADLIVALELDEANLLGISYGTRLALTVLRDRPENIRSAIIDAVYPVHVNGYDDQALNAYRAFRVLFDTCAVDAACSAAFPDLEQVFYATVDTLNDSPALFADEETGEEFEYTGDDLVNELFDLLYDTESLPDLPGIIYEYYTDAGEAPVDMGSAGSADTSGGLTAEAIDALSDEEFEALLMPYLGIDDVDAFYDYMDGLSDDEYFALLAEIASASGATTDSTPSQAVVDIDALSDEEFEALLMPYLGIDDVDEFYDTIDSLSDDEYAALIDEFLASESDATTRSAPRQDDDMADVDDDAEGMFAAIECQEELPFNSLAAAEGLAVGVPQQIAAPMLQSVAEQINACAAWGVPAADDFENAPVVSEIPVLVLSGEFDPITPPEWGQAAADYLPNSAHFVFPATGHGATDSHPCPTSIILAFLDAPENVASLDGSCIAEMRIAYNTGG